MERKLASVQIISKVEEHDNADSLDIVTVGGWKCIVRKGDFKEGDLCVYFEIDSEFPEQDVFTSIAPLKANKMRLKSVRLRGKLSQGLCLPLDILNSDYIENKKDLSSWSSKDDVTEYLGIKKYEKPISIYDGETKGHFPSFFPKTDQPRIQSNIELLDEIDGLECVITDKYDGTSFSAYYKDGEVGICKRNFEIRFGEEKKSAYQVIFEKYNLKRKLEAYGQNIVIQGELCGPKIQQNKLNLKENELFVFDIFDIDKQKYYNPFPFYAVCSTFGLKMVNTFKKSHVFSKDTTVEELLELAKGNYVESGKTKEGIVINPLKEKHSEHLGKRLSFKVINNDFLLSK